MVKIKPFAGIRPPKELAAEVLSLIHIWTLPTIRLA